MSELVVITTYYNPCGYASRRRNYTTFIEGMHRAGVTAITVECAFGDDPFVLPASLDVIQVRAKTLLWQKERLLNLAASWLPKRCKYVAWLDCDILFDNPDWPNDLRRTLRRYQVAQVFETCLRLDQAGEPGASPNVAESFASVMRRQPGLLNAGRYDVHGHTGYGWAMRRDIFDAVGLYQGAIAGSADHFMAHAIYADYNFCIQNALSHDARQIEHLQDWGRRFHARVRGSLGVVPGNITHLWHGDAVNRRYFLRMRDLTELGYDPWTDLDIQPGSPLEWSPNLNKPGLKEYFANYFASRREDGLIMGREPEHA